MENDKSRDVGRERKHVYMGWLVSGECPIHVEHLFTEASSFEEATKYFQEGEEIRKKELSGIRMIPRDIPHLDYDSIVRLNVQRRLPEDIWQVWGDDRGEKTHIFEWLKSQIKEIHPYSERWELEKNARAIADRLEAFDKDTMQPFDIDTGRPVDNMNYLWGVGPLMETLGLAERVSYDGVNRPQHYTEKARRVYQNFEREGYYLARQRHEKSNPWKWNDRLLGKKSLHDIVKE